MNNEAPERIFARACHPDRPNHNCTWSISMESVEGSVEYRRVDPPAAPDERDKALAQDIAYSFQDLLGFAAHVDLGNRIVSALATVRTEAREAAFKESADNIIDEAGKVGQLMDLASLSARKEERAEVKSTLLDYFKHFPCTCVGKTRTGGHFACCPITIRDEVLGRLEGLESARTGKVEG